MKHRQLLKATIILCYFLLSSLFNGCSELGIKLNDHPPCAPVCNGCPPLCQKEQETLDQAIKLYNDRLPQVSTSITLQNEAQADVTRGQLFFLTIFRSFLTSANTPENREALDFAYNRLTTAQNLLVQRIGFYEQSIILKYTAKEQENSAKVALESCLRLAACDTCCPDEKDAVRSAELAIDLLTIKLTDAQAQAVFLLSIEESYRRTVNEVKSSYNSVGCTVNPLVGVCLIGFNAISLLEGTLSQMTNLKNQKNAQITSYETQIQSTKDNLEKLRTQLNTCIEKCKK